MADNQLPSDIDLKVPARGPAGPKGDKGNDAVINVISQAEYDALADKSGVYFIEG